MWKNLERLFGTLSILLQVLSVLRILLDGNKTKNNEIDLLTETNN